MSDLQKKEYAKWNKLLNNEAKLLGYETRDGRFLKNCQGYIIYRKCNESSYCKSTWTLKVNVSNGKCKIFLTPKCKHLKIDNL